MEERPGIAYSTLNAMVSVKWKVSYHWDHLIPHVALHFGVSLNIAFCYRNWANLRSRCGTRKRLKAPTHTRKSWKSTTSLSWPTKLLLSRTPRDLFNWLCWTLTNFLVAYAVKWIIVELEYELVHETIMWNHSNIIVIVRPYVQLLYPCHC